MMSVVEIVKTLSFLVFFYTSIAHCTDVSVQFEPEIIDRLRIDKSTEITAHFNSNISGIFNLTLECEEPDVCQINNYPQTIQLEDNSKTTINFTLVGLFIGYTKLVLKVGNEEQVNMTYKPLKISILLTKAGDKRNTVFFITVAVVVLTNTFLMGTQLDVEVLKDCFLQPKCLIIGFCSQYLVMPLMAFVWTRAFLQDHIMYQFAFFVVGCSPGGSISNLWTVALDGNLDLSIAMTFMSTVTAFVMLPFWLYTLGRAFYVEQTDIHIPYLKIFETLAVLVSPLLIGMLLIYAKPELKAKIEKFFKILMVTFLLLLVLLFFLIEFYVIRLFRWYTLLCGFLLPLSGYVIGYIIPFLLKQSHKDCITIAIETGVQNIPIALLVNELSMPPPYDHLGQVMPISTFVMGLTPLLAWIISYKLYNKSQKDENYGEVK